jgi:membrane protein YqaA with SNARE-associated domain
MDKGAGSSLKEKRRRAVIGVLAVLAVVFLTALAYWYRDRVSALPRFGYPGVFLVELIANATIILPIPGSAVTTAISPLLNPWILAPVAATGAALGELSAYAAGLGGNVLIENQRWYLRVKGWMQKYGSVVVLLMAFIPNPFFDTAGLVAGSLRMKVVKFFFWCWAGKVLNRLLLVFGASALIIRLFPHLL